MRPVLLYSDSQLVCRRLFNDPKMHDLDQLFGVKFCIPPVCLTPTVDLTINNCVKTNEVTSQTHTVCSANPRQGL